MVEIESSGSTPSRPRQRRRPIVRIAVALLSIAVVTMGSLWLLTWWDDRPLRQIEAELKSENYQVANRMANRFLAKHPGDMRAGILKARSLAGMNRHKEADEWFQRVAIQAKGFPDNPDALRAWSTSLLHLKQWSRAITILENILENHPDDQDILYSLTAARLRVRRYASALESAQRLAAIPEMEDKANVIIGTVHHDRGNRREAVSAWNKVLDENPDAKNLQIAGDEFLRMVGEELLAVGNPQRAAEILQRSVAIRPSGNAYASLGKAYAQIGKPTQAIQAWKKAVALDRLQLAARGELANAALQSGKPKEAVDWLLPVSRGKRIVSSNAYILQRAYTQLNETESARVWKEKAKTLREAESKRSTLDDLLRRSTDPYWTTLLHCYQLAMDERWDEAQAFSDELRTKRPNDALVKDLSKAIRERGRLPKLSRLTGKQF